MSDKKLTELTLLTATKVSDLLYLVTYDADGVSVSRAITVADFQTQVASGVNRIISGQVVYTGTGYIFQTVNLNYKIAGVLYFSDGDQVTLTTPDGTFDRLDNLFVDADGLDVKDGTPAATPAVPSLDNPDSEISTNIVLVGTGTTQPSQITLETIYSENAQEVGGEWDTFEPSAGARITLANTSNPINLTKDIAATAPDAATDYLKFNNTSPILIADFKNLRQTFRSRSDWKNDYLQIEFYDSTTLVGFYVIDRNSFPTRDTVTTHEVYINDSQVAWTPSETQFDEIRYVWKDAGGTTTVSNVRFNIDLIYVEHGGTTTTNKPISYKSADISVDASSFSGNLSSTDTDVQTAFDTIDNLSLGTGNVSNSGTPLNDQIAVWVDANTIEGTDNLKFDNITAVCTIGENDSQHGNLYIYGNSSTIGGNFRIYNSANFDSDDDYYSIGAGSGNFQIVGSSTGVFLEYKSSTNELKLYDYVVPLIVAFSDESTALTTGTGKVEFQMPNYATTLIGVAVTLSTAPTTSALTVDLNEGGTSVLSTKITVDATEKTSETAATPPVISDSSLAANAVMTVDVDTLDSGGTSAGGKIILYYKRA